MARLPSLKGRSATAIASLALRLFSLVGKLALTLFMGRFFPLSELGLYGLAFGAVMLAIVLLGFRVDYVIARDILGMDPHERRRVGSDVAALYLASFAVTAPVAMAALIFSGATGDLTLPLLICLLCGVEAYANYLYTVTIALKRPALANAAFFLRSGAWTVPAMAMSYAEPAWRTAEFIIGWWVVGVTASIIVNLWAMRAQMFGRFTPGAIRWSRLRAWCGTALLVWAGSVAVTLGTYLDRFILASYLTLEDVGVATFYLSFTAAALTLVQSATTSVTFPALIDHFDAGRMDDFRREFRRTAIAALGLALLILGGLAATMPILASLLGKPQLSAAYPAFLLLAVATLVRIHAETLYYALFVERRHRAIWVGNFLFFGVSLLFNLIFVPIGGLQGLGFAAILASTAILGWRMVSARAPAAPALAAPADPAIAQRAADEGEGLG